MEYLISKLVPSVTKKLFFTATPRILSKRIKTASRQHEIDVASMDDKSLFGEVFHKLNFSEAIKKKILSDYQVSIVGVENKQISEMIRVRKLIQTYKDYHFDAETLGIFISLIKSIENYNLRKLITFQRVMIIKFYLHPQNQREITLKTFLKR